MTAYCNCDCIFPKKMASGRSNVNLCWYCHYSSQNFFKGSFEEGNDFIETAWLLMLAFMERQRNGNSMTTLVIMIILYRYKFSWSP